MIYLHKLSSLRALPFLLQNYLAELLRRTLLIEKATNAMTRLQLDRIVPCQAIPESYLLQCEKVVIHQKKSYTTIIRYSTTSALLPSTAVSDVHIDKFR